MTDLFSHFDAPGTSNNAGPLYSTHTTQGPTVIDTYYDYQWWDSAKEKNITSQPYNSQAPDWKAGYSRFDYDVNGHIKQVDDPLGGRSIRYTNDAQGQILVRDELGGGFADAQGVVTSGTVDNHRNYYYLDGHRIGDVGNDGPQRISYAEQLAQPKNVSRKDAYKNWRPISSADFDQNYEPINSHR